MSNIRTHRRRQRHRRRRRPPGRVPEESNKLFVGSLPADIMEDELRLVVSYYGEIANVHLGASLNKFSLRAALVSYLRRGPGAEAVKVLHEVYKFREGSQHPSRVKWCKDAIRGNVGMSMGVSNTTQPRSLQR